MAVSPCTPCQHIPCLHPHAGLCPASTHRCSTAPAMQRPAQCSSPLLPITYCLPGTTHTCPLQTNPCFLQVNCSASQRGELRDLMQIFRTSVIDVSANTMTVEVQGREDKMRALVELLEPYGACCCCHAFGFV